MVVYRILDELIATELVTDTLKSKVVPYLQRHGLSIDTVLLNYIKVSKNMCVCMYECCVYVCLYDV